MNLLETKPAVKSLSIRANLAGIIAIVALVQEIIVNNPELIHDTRVWFLSIGALITQGIAIFGRWSAIVGVAGVFKKRV